MKKILIRCALWLGAGAAIGCAINVQPAVAGCFGTMACSSDKCCVGSARSNSIKQPHGLHGTIGSCGTIHRDDATTGAKCGDDDAIDTQAPCGGAAAVAC